MEYSVYANYSKMQYSIVLQAVADPEILKKGGGQKTMYQPRHYLSQMLTGRGGLMQKIPSQ